MRSDLGPTDAEAMVIPPGAGLVICHVRRERLGLGTMTAGRARPDQVSALVCETPRPPGRQSFLCTCGRVRWVTG
jgi:hypothetical protein